MNALRPSRAVVTDIFIALPLALLGIALVLLRFRERSSLPCISEERVYWFQAKTLLQGHLSFPYLLRDR